MTREAPGGVTIRSGLGSQPQKRDFGLAVPVFHIIVSAGRDIAIGVFAAWLYDKLKRSGVRTIRMGRRTVEVAPEGIQRDGGVR